MSDAEKRAVEAFPDKKDKHFLSGLMNDTYRAVFILGYEQATKDIYREINARIAEHHRRLEDITPEEINYEISIYRNG